MWKSLMSIAQQRPTPCRQPVEHPLWSLRPKLQESLSSAETGQHIVTNGDRNPVVADENYKQGEPHYKRLWQPTLSKTTKIT